jgi:hypothetical protein
LPIRIQDYKERGTVINAMEDRLRTLDCSAHAGLPIQVGFSARDGSKQVECWAPVVLEPVNDAMQTDLPTIPEKEWGIFEK